MKASVGAIAVVGLLAGCAGGSQYSSQRATQGAPVTVAQPVQAPQTVQAVPEFIAVTPGAVPVTDATPLPLPVEGVQSGEAPVLAGASSLRPPVRSNATYVAQAPAGSVAPTPAVARAPVPVQPAVLFATGPIFDACRSAGRKAATKQRCGCIQAVADRELTPAQQRRGAGYFDDQAKLQDVRQSDAARNEVFWAAWKSYGQAAARQCG